MLSTSGAAWAEQVFSFDATPAGCEECRSRSLCDRRQAGYGESDAISFEVIDIEVREPTARIVLNAVNTTFDAVSIDATRSARISRRMPPRDRDVHICTTARGGHTGCASASPHASTNSTAAFSSSTIRPTCIKRMLSSKLEPSERGGFPVLDEPPSRRALASR